jgi:hypothetical protein
MSFHSVLSYVLYVKELHLRQNLTRILTPSRLYLIDMGKEGHEATYLSLVSPMSLGSVSRAGSCGVGGTGRAGGGRAGGVA